MSNVEDRIRSMAEVNELEARYKAARAKIERSRRIEAGQAGALYFAAMAYGDAMEESGGLARATHVAKLICIAALFVIPNLLVIRVLF